MICTGSGMHLSQEKSLVKEKRIQKIIEEYRKM